ncbi:MAG: hypothetical protein NWQ45_03555 [Congregibacter sp.]|jgi:hypothetical protein|nr:hypothetical protein [Congregibacter sp.]
MPAFVFLAAMLLTAGATAVGMYMLGPDATEKRTECVEKMTDALKPTSVDGVKQIVTQCKERFPD